VIWITHGDGTLYDTEETNTVSAQFWRDSSDSIQPVAGAMTANDDGSFTWVTAANDVQSAGDFWLLVSVNGVLAYPIRFTVRDNVAFDGVMAVYPQAPTYYVYEIPLGGMIDSGGQSGGAGKRPLAFPAVFNFGEVTEYASLAQLVPDLQVYLDSLLGDIVLVQVNEDQALIQVTTVNEDMGVLPARIVSERPQVSAVWDSGNHVLQVSQVDGAGNSKDETDQAWLGSITISYGHNGEHQINSGLVPFSTDVSTLEWITEADISAHVSGIVGSDIGMNWSGLLTAVGATPGEAATVRYTAVEPMGASGSTQIPVNL